MEEIRVYVINMGRLSVDSDTLTDEEFMDIAEEQGSVFSIEGFTNLFNTESITSLGHEIRFITIEN